MFISVSLEFLVKDEVGKVKSEDEMVRKANEQKKTEQTFVSSPSPDILSFPEGWRSIKLGKKTSRNFLNPPRSFLEIRVCD